MFCFLQQKCTKPKGNSTEEVWPFKKQVNKSIISTLHKKIHWPQLLKHSGFYVSTICWARVRLYKSWCGNSGVSLMDLGKFDRHFRSPVWPRLLDVQGEYRLAYWWLAETQFQVDNFENHPILFVFQSTINCSYLSSRARNIWPPLHYK